MQRSKSGDSFILEINERTMTPKKRQLLEVLLRGAHEKEEVRQGLAAVLRCPPADIGWMMDSDGKAAKFVIDHLCRGDGFRTQITLSLAPKASPEIDGDRGFANLLAKSFHDDALVLDDPARPGGEPFHGLLIRPDGRAYRVPLRELASGGMGIDESPAAWEEWNSAG